MRKTAKFILTGAAALAAALAWHAEGSAAETAAAGVGIVTVFDHAKIDGSFLQALANGGSAPLWSRTSDYGTSDVSVHSRETGKAECPAQGCSHKTYTAVVIIVSGSATMEVGGAAKTNAADKFGGDLIQGGGSRRISAGDVFIMPPDTLHWYRNVTAPFRYIEVPVP